MPTAANHRRLPAAPPRADIDRAGEQALANIINHDEHFKTLMARCRAQMSHAFDFAEECREVFTPMLNKVQDNEGVEIDEIAQLAREGNKDLGSFKSDMDMYNMQLRQFGKLPFETLLGILKLDSSKLRDALLPSPAECLGEIQLLLPELGSEKVAVLLKELNNANAELGKERAGVEDFCSYLEFLEKLQGKQDAIAEAYAKVEEHYELMSEQNVYVKPEQMAVYGSVTIEFSNMKSTMDGCESRKAEDIMNFSVLMESNIKTLEADRKAAKNSAQDEIFLEYSPTGMEESSEVMLKLTELDETSTNLKAQAETIKAQQKLFNKHDANSSGEVARFEELRDVVDDIQLKKRLWDSLREFGALTTQWTATKFEELDADEMTDIVGQYNKTVMNAERSLPSNNVVVQLSQMVSTFKNTVPIITDLSNKNLKDRHWGKIEGVIGNPVPRDDPEKFTFGTLLELRVMHFKEQIQIISTEATQEGILEEMLQKVIDMWADTEFTLLSYKEQKDVYILGAIDDVMVLVDDSMVTMGTITASRFVGGIREKVEQYEKGLNVFSETLDEALGVQKAWMYLESIFCAQDIQRQLPEESKMFFDVDKTWRSILKTAKDLGNAFKSFTAKGLLETLQKCVVILDKVQNSLEDYLEKKRMAFPRFYFLSNDELLEILAQTRDPHAVQPHMGKCFDAIKSLDFGGADGRPETADHRIYGMKSPEGEVIDYGPNLKARGNVEIWLTAVEKEMRDSLRDLMKEGVLDYANKLRHEWVYEHASQIVLAVSSIYWAREVLHCFHQDNVCDELKSALTIITEQLGQLTLLVRLPLTKLQRKTIGTLITLDVHSRDIVAEFIHDETFLESDFGWAMQLRFYWLEDEDNCRVRQTNAGFWYNYEYMGAQMRLVVTPMTDRCYMTLTGALHLKLGGAPAGPAGTGKTETTKDLAKGLGIQCVVFNCGDNLDFHFMAKFFMGLCQCGAWACFDEFNRINIEVLSVVAQQMISIQNALRAIPKDQTQSTFIFEGKEIKILETFGCFITMNPGYAGRTELPDNLKVRQCTVLGLGGVTISNSIALTHPVPQPEGALPAGLDDDPELHHGRRGHALFRGLPECQAALDQVHQVLQALVRAALPAEALRLRHARRQVRAGHGWRSAAGKP